MYNNTSLPEKCGNYIIFSDTCVIHPDMNLFNFAIEIFRHTIKNYHYASSNYCNCPYCCGGSFVACKHLHSNATHNKKHTECRYCNNYYNMVAKSIWVA
jgi:hypothetical protein